MTQAQEILLALLSQALFKKPISLPDADWNAVFTEARVQTVSYLAYSCADKNALPADLAARLSLSAKKATALSIRSFYSHTRIHEWMTQEQIPYVILKGCASAAYYPNPLYRAMGDVDFLVPDRDLARAGAVLESNGLTCDGNSRHHCHIVYRKEKVHVELHFAVNGIPDGEPGKLIRAYLKDIFDKAEERPAGAGGAMMVPSHFHHGLILLMHTWRHMTREGIDLRHLCDWACFAASLGEAEFCELFEEKLKAVGMWRFTQALTRVSIRYLGMAERAWAVCDADVAEQMLEDILAGGAFGRKADNRIMETMLITDGEDNLIGKKNMTAQFVRSANKMVRQNWPAAEKHRILLPLGWAYFGLRRGVREITGKRKKTNVRKTLDSAARRRNLYMRLRMYEKE